MDRMSQPTAVSDRPADRTGRGLFFLLMVAATFTYPVFPLTELDSSWRQTLTLALVEGWQFGKDIVFTYGPLGLLMANTYSGVAFWPFVLWQAFSSVLFAWVIYRQGLRLGVYARALYWVAMVTFGICYADALHMIVIALIGFDLVRAAGGNLSRGRVVDLLLLGLLAAVKFTNLMLAAFVVLVAAGLELALRRPRAALRLALWFGGSFLLVWMACRQNPLNLPAYLLTSLEISSGYEQTMGLPTSPWAMNTGLPVLLVLVVYAFLHLLTAQEKPRALARCLVLGAFTYINWKHGFVRSDGHLIGFYICALVPLTGFPALLDDPPRLGWVRWVLLCPAIVLCLMGLQGPMPLTRHIIPLFLDKVVGNVTNTWNFSRHYQTYREKLRAERNAWDLPRTREVVGRASIDFLHYTQAIILHNRMNYRPRPVIQSYSAYTPALIRLNAEHYASDRAPDFVLLRMESIDGRYPALDDSELLYLFMHRYEFVHTEKGLQLWRRKPGPFNAAALAPRPLRSAEMAVNERFDLGADSGKLLWARIDLRPSLLGRLRSFFYKPPFVQLRIKDDKGREASYRLPLPQARAGFMLSPVIDDVFGYMRFASELPQRHAREITVAVEPADRKYLADSARIELGELTRSRAGETYLTQATQAEFPTFKALPLAYEAKTPPSKAKLDGHPVVVMHAPSEMVFQIPAEAKTIAGSFGYLPGAWSDGGNTNGAEFIVYWANGAERIEIFKRYLSPVSNPLDRGLQRFEARLPDRVDGRLFLQISAGAENNFAWDWTVWSDVEFRPADPGSK